MSELPDFIPATLPSSAVSRQNPDSTTATALAPACETRVVVLAMGAQFVFQEADAGYAVNQLQTRGLAMTKLADCTYSYTNSAQQVTYILFTTTDKRIFKQALQADNIIVVYSGHARHGMGPCFHGQQDAPGDWWYDGDAPDNGIFRMGYPYVAVPISDLLQSQYHARPLTADESKPDRDATNLHPKLMQNYGALRQLNLSDLDANPDNVTLLGGLLPDGPYWGLDCIADSGKQERHLVMHAGWDDLSATPFSCRAFVHGGCSTFIHNYPIVRFLDGWKKDGDQKLAYWTTAATPAAWATPLFLFHLFSCQLQSGFGLWEPIFNYAVAKANREAPGNGFSFRFI